MMTALAATASPQPPTPEQIKMIVEASKEGLPTYQAICVSCHGPPNPNTPPRSALAAMTADQIYQSLTTGKMIFAAQTLDDRQKRAVSIYLTGKPLSAPPIGEATPATGETAPLAPAPTPSSPAAPAEPAPSTPTLPAQ